MPGRILIIDSVVANRAVLKAKMRSAHYDVDTCSHTIDAAAVIATQRPDLILINLSDPHENRHAFCRKIKQNPATYAINIIAVGGADTSQARLAALDAGIEDVLPHPVNSTLLLARVRSLLRPHRVLPAFDIFNDSSNPSGFRETSSHFEPAMRVTLWTGADDTARRLRQVLEKGLGTPVRLINLTLDVTKSSSHATCDLCVVNGGSTQISKSQFLGLVADLRTAEQTRSSALLVVVPAGQPVLSAKLFDLGADAVVSANISDAEMTVRTKALIRQRVSPRAVS